MLPIERTKVNQMRHANEVELLRKVQAGLKGKKNVSFKVNQAKAIKGKATIVKTVLPPEQPPDAFPYDKYVSELVDGMN